MSVPNRIYLDTSVAVAALFIGTQHYAVARAYFERLFAANTVICFSDLLRVELLQAARRIGTTPGLLPESTRRRHRLQHWGRLADAREAWLRYGLDEFEALLDQFYGVDEYALTPAIFSASVTLMAQHNLKSYDALHVATARAVGAPRLVTLDRDYAAVTQPSIVLLSN